MKLFQIPHTLVVSTISLAASGCGSEKFSPSLGPVRVADKSNSKCLSLPISFQRLFRNLHQGSPTWWPIFSRAQYATNPAPNGCQCIPLGQNCESEFISILVLTGGDLWNNKVREIAWYLLTLRYKMHIRIQATVHSTA